MKDLTEVRKSAETIIAVFGYMACNMIMAAFGKTDVLLKCTEGDSCLFRGACTWTSRCIDVLCAKGHIREQDKGLCSNLFDIVGSIRLPTAKGIRRFGNAVRARRIPEDAPVMTRRSLGAIVLALQVRQVLFRMTKAQCDELMDNRNKLMQGFVERHKDNKVARRIVSCCVPHFPEGLTNADKFAYAVALEWKYHFILIGDICWTWLGVRDPAAIADVLSLLAVGHLCERTTVFPLCERVSDVFMMLAMIACRAKIRPSQTMMARGADLPDEHRYKMHKATKCGNSLVFFDFMLPFCGGALDADDIRTVVTAAADLVV